MAALLNVMDQRYVVDSDGNPIACTIYFYLTGTTTLATVYSNSALTIPRTNPVPVAANAPVPTIWLNSATEYRRLIVLSNGDTSDIDPIDPANALSFLPLSGGTLTGALTVQGNISGYKVTAVSPNSGTSGAVVIKDAAGNPDTAYLQFTNNAASAEYAWIKGNAAGTITMGMPVTFSGKITTKAGTTASASINIPAGVAPTSPANGDIWATAAGIFARLGGATSGLLRVTGMSLGTSGYIKVNDGTMTNDLIFQWRQVAGAAGAGTAFTWPIAFPTAIFNAQATGNPGFTGSGSYSTYFDGACTTTGGTVQANNGGGVATTVNVFAIGW